MFELTICTAAGDVLRRYDLSRVASSGKRILIGRAEDCDIRIKNGSVSRHHCSIEATDDDEWIVRDLGSTCGSYVGGERIGEVEIEPGLAITIGPAVLRFESVAGRVAADLQKELGEE